MLDDELRTLLSAHPSADFTSRVREAVRNDTPSHSWSMHGVVALAAAVVFAFWLSSVPEQPKVTSASSLAAAYVGAPAVALREVVSDVRPVGPPAVSRLSSPQEPSPRPSKIQLDPVERRTLQALFAHPPDVHVELPAVADNPIVIPAMTVAPLKFESLSQGSSQ